MDLSNLNLGECADKGALLTLANPITGKLLEDNGVPMTITLAGADSSAFRKKQREIQYSRLQQIAVDAGFDFDSIESDECELLAAATLGWSGLVMKGKPLEFSHDAVVELYKSQAWIREQVDVFVGARANFFMLS